jgi:ubiquinone/menaquinone biosynthesis C-methylase UbiE
VVAAEPSAVMLGQRPANAARAVQASAEWLPFADDSFDSVIAVLSDHH